jgi:hypothetical protein
MLDVSGEVFGLRFEAVTVPVWHEEVIYCDVLTTRDGPRSSAASTSTSTRARASFPPAAAWPVRGVKHDAPVRTPSACWSPTSIDAA